MSLQQRNQLDAILRQGRLDTTEDVPAPEGLRARVQDHVAGADAADPFISPIFGDLGGLPALLIQVGSHEVLLSDAVPDGARAAIDSGSAFLRSQLAH